MKSWMFDKPAGTVVVFGKVDLICCLPSSSSSFVASLNKIGVTSERFLLFGSRSFTTSGRLAFCMNINCLRRLTIRTILREQNLLQDLQQQLTNTFNRCFWPTKWGNLRLSSNFTSQIEQWYHRILPFGCVSVTYSRPVLVKKYHRLYYKIVFHSDISFWQVWF
jgi:hypothetical protein